MDKLWAVCSVVVLCLEFIICPRGISKRSQKHAVAAGKDRPEILAPRGIMRDFVSEWIMCIQTRRSKNEFRTMRHCGQKEFWSRSFSFPMWILGSIYRFFFLWGRGGVFSTACI